MDIITSDLGSHTAIRERHLVLIEGDIAERSVVSQRAFDAAVSRGERLDAIILNAAILSPVGRVAETDVAAWSSFLISAFWIGPHGRSFYSAVFVRYWARDNLLRQAQLALPYLRNTNGQILMTSSGVSLRPSEGGWIAYACSKAAMNWLAACLVQEETQVSIICVTPGIVDSGQQEEVRKHRK